MKHDTRAPFRSLRELVLKELQGERSLLVRGDDRDFASEKLNIILENEAYILDREAIRSLPKSEAKAQLAAGRRAPRFAPSVIRLSRAGRSERDAHHGAGPRQRPARPIGCTAFSFLRAMAD